MNIQTFYKNYNFDEVKVLSIIGDGETLKIDLEMEVYIPLIANGFRPEFDLDYIYEFIFSSFDKVSMNEPIKILDKRLENNQLILFANNQKITILNKEIQIKKIQ